MTRFFHFFFWGGEGGPCTRSARKTYVIFGENVIGCPQMHHHLPDESHVLYDLGG